MIKGSSLTINSLRLGKSSRRAPTDSICSGSRARGLDLITIDYGVEDVIENLGLLKYEETADLYRKCAVGLAMMATPHPSYLPFEFMATGCLPVGIHNPGTTWFYKHEQNCLLSEASTTCLTDTLERALCEETMRANIARNARNEIRTRYSDWMPEMAKIYRFLCAPKPRTD